MPDVTFTFRVDAPLKEAFASIAKANHRNASLLLRDYMLQYVNAHTAEEPAAVPKRSRAKAAKPTAARAPKRKVRSVA